MTKSRTSSGIMVGIRGGGDIASGVAWRLYHCGLRVFLTELDQPRTVRRRVAFAEAVYEGKALVEGVEALLIADPDEAHAVWDQEKIPLLVDPTCEARYTLKPDVIIDALLAKKNLGTATMQDAPLVIALGPGFQAGKDAHFVVETNRGHFLGRLLAEGCAEPDTGIPGPVLGITSGRVLRAPENGPWKSYRNIGDMVKKGDLIGSVAAVPVKAAIDGMIRGLIRPGLMVEKGLKVGDIDPRGRRDYCYSISDRALAIAGGVMEGIFRVYKPSQR